MPSLSVFHTRLRSFSLASFYQGHWSRHSNPPVYLTRMLRILGWTQLPSSCSTLEFCRFLASLSKLSILKVVNSLNPSHGASLPRVYGSNIFAQESAISTSAMLHKYVCNLRELDATRQSIRSRYTSHNWHHKCSHYRAALEIEKQQASFPR